jgi:uncharacterized repeat protein (TIGR01451 family)
MFPFTAVRFQQVTRIVVAIGLALLLLVLTTLVPQSTAQASGSPAAPLSGVSYVISNPADTVVAAPLLAPSISASKRDSLAVDVNSNGQAEPGDTIRYTLHITNAGPDPATGVALNDTIDLNTTLVAGSVNVSPLARDDSYTAVGNTLLEVGVTPSGFPAAQVAGSVLDNDSEFLGDTFSVQAPFPTTSANGGTVTFEADGNFSYLPPVGFTGTDTFTYTITDGSLTATGTVTITVSDRVWYVRNNAAAGGTGRSNSPFNTLAAAETASAINDYIYIHTGDGTTTNQNAGITLKNGQRLIGQGVALVVGSYTLNAAGTRPLIAGGAGTGVALLQNNTVRGLNIGNSTPGISGNNFGTLALDTVSINSNNAALILNTGTANATFTNVTSSGGNVNVNLTGVAGTVALGTGALSGAISYNLLINQGTANVSYGGTITAGNVTRPVEITNKTGGSVTLSGLISTATSSISNGIFLNNNTGGGTYSFTGGVQLTTGSNPAFTATGTGNIEVTGTNNTLATTSGQAINIANSNRTANGITFRSVSVSGATTGVLLNSVGGTGAFTITGTGTTNSSGGTIANVSTRGVSILSTNNVALSNMTFTNTPTSNGTPATCGDLESGQPGNTGCNAAIHLATVTGATLTNTDISGGVQQGVNGNSVTNFSLTNSALSNMGDEIDESGVRLQNVFGTSSISNNTIDDGYEGNIYVINTTNTPGTLTVNGNTLNNSTLGAGGRFATSNVGNLTVNATNNTIQNNLNTGLQMAFDGGGGSFTATNNTVLNGGSPGISVGGTGGTATYNISDNTVTNPDLVSFNAGASGNINLSGRIDNNTTDGPESPAANSIVVTSNSTAVHTALVEDNDITNYDGTSTAMFILANQGSATGNFTVRNNIITGDGNIGATNGILIRIGSLATDTNQACIAAYGNDVNGWNPALIQVRVHLRFDTDTTHFRNGQTGTDDQILDANHPLNPAAAVAYDTTAPATSTQTNTPCALPSEAPARPLAEDDVRPLTGLTDEKFSITRPVAPVIADASTEMPPVAKAVLPSAEEERTESLENAAGLAGETISLTLGTLPPNKRIIVVFNAIISNPVAAGANSISNQGTISGSNFSNVLTDDPDIAGTANPTLTPLVAQPDYSINKSDAIASVVPGGTITYTLQYTNSGNQGGASVRLTETVPANTTFNAGASSAGWVCTPNNNAGSTCINTIGTVNGGGTTGSRVFAVTVINPVAAGVTQISNTGSIGDNNANGVDPTPANNSDTETTPVTANPDISVSKSDGGASGTPGGTITYAVTVSNIGNQGATGVVLTEIVPANTTFNPGASSAGWVCAPNNNAGSTCTLAVGSLAGGGANVVRNFAVTVINPVPSGVTQISNTASAADDGTNGTDPSGNNSGSDTTPITAAPDISVTKTDGGISTTPGSTYGYTVTVSNVGNQNAVGVVLTETVPANTTFNAAGSTAGWSCANNSPAGTTCTQSIGALNGGSASTTRRFAVTVVNPVAAGVSQISNTASAADDGTNGTDPAPANNSGSDTTPVTAAPDYSITKTDGGISTTPGSTVAYTLNYANGGNQGGTGVVLSEVVPANTTFNAGASTAGWVCAPNNNAGSICTLSVGGLAGGGAAGSATYAVTVANPVAAGVTQISNTATIADDGANGADPNSGNNSASDTTPITATPDLSVSKTDGNVTGIPGSTVVYTITYSNTGNQGATGVVLTETVPANTTFNAGASSAGWSCANGSPAGTTCTNTIGALAGGGTGSRLFAVTVNLSLPGGTTSTSNTVTIADDGANGADPTPANNTDTEITPVFAAPDIQIVKGDGNISTTPGGTVAYSLAYSNTGTIGATGVVITETVPANTTFNAGASSAGWSCANGSPAGTTCTQNIGAVAVNTGGTRTFAVTVINPVAAGVTQISNTATIDEDGTNGTDPDTTNNTDTETTPVTAAPDMVITKSDGGTTTTPGATVVYNLNYSNAGNQGATGVVISEVVPANSTFNAGSSSAGWVCTPNNNAGSTCTNTIGSVNGGGATGSRTFAVTVINPVPAGVTQISNTATIADDAANGTDPTPANNSASDTTPVTATPDLSLNKDDGGISATLGTVIPYTLTVTNGGNQGAAGVTLTETVPANTTFNAVGSSAGWSCANGSPAGTTCTNSVGGLNGGGTTATRVFAVQVNAVVAPSVTQISNSASVADNGANGADPTPANNSDTETTPLNIAANLSISKDVSDSEVVPGQPITYTIAYTNAGPQLSTGVVITDLIPSLLDNVSFTASPIVTATPGFTYVWQVGTVAAGGDGTITVVGTVDPAIAADTTITNTATIRGNFDSTNSSDSAATNVVLPRVAFAAANVDFTEEAANATITVTLDRPNPYRAITVTYDTSDGTATNGADYTDVTGVITFTAGMTQTSFTVPVLEDTIDESNESVNLSLSAPNGAVLGTPTTATLTILDDDNAPTIALSSATYSAGEGDGTATVTANLSNPSAFTVTVDYNSTDGTATAGDDYTAVSDTLTFAPGDTEGTFDVTLLEDVIDETNETLTLTLSAPVSGTLGSPSSATLTINDNDAAPSIAFDSATYSADEGAGSTTMTVTLSNPSVFTVTVDYATGDGTATAGTDYTGISGTLTFEPGSTSDTFDVAIFEDTTDEDDETVIMTLTNAISGTVGTPNPATLTILDNDGEPTINFPTSEFSIGEEDGTATLTVTLSNPSDFPITVDYETGDGTATAGDDYVAASGTLTFTPGVTTTTFSVTVINDTLDENDETVLLTLTNPSAFELGGGATATLTIEDDDASPTIAVNDVQVIEGNAGVTPMTFEVTLSALSGLSVTVDYDTADGTATAGSDYTAASGSVVIPAGELTGTFTIDVLGDLNFEPDETVLVDLTAPVNTTLGGSQGIGTILNDDIATAVTLSTLNVTSGDVRNSTLLLMPLGVVAAWWLWRKKTRKE